PFSMALRCLGNPGRIKIEIDDDYVNGKFYSVGGGASLAFRPEVVGQAHVFLTPFSSFVICDRAFKDAVHDAGIPDDAGESGISFIDASGSDPGRSGSTGGRRKGCGAHC
ncbi:imm11 family protein, partial [Xanthomonas citri]